MAKQDILIGQVDYTALVFIPDPASTDGSGKTGLVAADLTVSGVRVETDNDVTVTDYTGSLNNLAALTTAHTDWGVLEVSNTLAPGLYRLDIADALFATGAWSAAVYVMITTSAAAASPMEYQLTAYDPQVVETLPTVTEFATAVRTELAVELGRITGDAYAVVANPTHGNAALKVIADNIPTNAELATALTTVPAAVLAAATAAPIAANVEQINTVTIVGNGAGTPFGV